MICHTSGVYMNFQLREFNICNFHKIVKKNKLNFKFVYQCILSFAVKFLIDFFTQLINFFYVIQIKHFVYCNLKMTKMV